MRAKLEKVLRKIAIFFILKWVASKSKSTHDVLMAMFDLLDEL